MNDIELPKKKNRRLRTKKRSSNETVNNDEIFVNGHIPSKYQVDIFDFIRYGSGNAVINALAGSSKTTTIVTAAKLIPDTCNALFIAFNREIVKELEKKLDELKNVQVKTLHSLGLLMVKRNLGFNIEIDEFKYRSFIKKNINAISNGEVSKMDKRSKDEYTENVISLCELGRFNLCQTEKELLEVASRHDVPIIGDECKSVLNVFEWGKENYTSIDFTDMVWLPYELNLQPKGLQYDFIFVDESQDLNVAQRELFLRCFKSGTRFIAVGDPNQCIYSFAGADYKSFAKLQQLPNTKTYPLPISYRCPKKVIDLANNFVNNMEPRENAPIGEIKYSVKIKELKNGDMVLCRVKLPLMKLYMRLLRMGVKCFIRGNDIGLNLIKLIKQTEKDELNITLSKDGVFVRLYERLFNERDRLVTRWGLDPNDALMTSQIVNLYDSIKSIETISDGLNNSYELIKRIENIFSDDSDGICLSTIHKAKGLEADNVYILCRNLMPSKLAKQDWEILQEENLMYVAYTRAKKVLGFISENDMPSTFGAVDLEKTARELNAIENIICKLTGKKPSVKMSDKDISDYKIRNIEEIKPIVNNSATLKREDIYSKFNNILDRLMEQENSSEKIDKFLKQFEEC